MYKPQRRGTAPTVPNFCVVLCIFCVVLCNFVLFYVLFVFVVLCIVCVYMCAELLPPAGYPIAVNPLNPKLNPSAICWHY